MSSKDDLAELRKMIKECKHNIADYAFEVKDLKKDINNCNTNFQEVGYGLN